MFLVEGFLKDSLFIDFGTEINYGSDQVNLTCPVRFATVGFQLMATNGLSQIADRIRKDMGFRPMHPMDEYNDETCDQEGWYEFYIGLNDWVYTKVDSCIEFVVVNSQSEDNEQIYTIDLGASDQEMVYSLIDEQCRKNLGKSCEELLDEARTKLMEDERTKEVSIG